MLSTTKICTKCGIKKLLGEFSKAKAHVDGHHSWCKECTGEYWREWYKKNSKYRREVVCEWNQKNSERAREHRRKWLKKNPGYINKWHKENPEKINTYSRIRRAHKLNADGSFTADEWITLCNYYSSRCLRCGRTDKKLTADHVIPIGPPLLGTNYITNIQPLCGSCNSKKYKRTDDYRLDELFILDEELIEKLTA